MVRTARAVASSRTGQVPPASLYVRGLQSTGVAATIKHYVGNESEHQRMSMSSEIPERALRELYLLPFERAVKEAGVMAVMTGYNRVDGSFMADHRHLVTKVLREEWGFDGLVMSDWGAEHDTVQSVLAGCDLEMPAPTRERGDKLVAAVRDDRLAADAVRACARRVLQLADRLGSFAEAPRKPTLEMTWAATRVDSPCTPVSGASKTKSAAPTQTRYEWAHGARCLWAKTAGSGEYWKAFLAFLEGAVEKA
jgi:beta-glucosidase-like glycosyl hydrolase